MEKNGATMKAPDLSHFEENRDRFPVNQILAFAGQHIAWSPDGTRILAAAPTRAELDAQLESAGIHWSQVVHDFVDPPLE